jgi:hypothetical protein
LAKNTGTSDYKNPEGPVFTIVGTGGSDSAGLEEIAPFMVSQHDSKFGLLDIYLSENKLNAKFVTNDGQILDQFSISKTTKKKVIERISDTTDTNTGIMEVSDKKSNKAKPLAGQDGKPSITFKLDEEATAKPLAGQDGKPSITFKLDEASTSANAKPLLEEEVQEVKPAVTAKLGDNPSTDGKPVLLNQQNVDSSNKEKSASFEITDNTGRSNTKELGTTDNNNHIKNEVSDFEGETINTNLRDPFASLH